MKGVNLITENPITAERLSQLRSAAGEGPLLILTHDSPDPDALASGNAMGFLCEQAWEIPCELAYTGLVARAENRTMLHLLTPKWRRVEDLSDLSRFSGVALVDTQPAAGNNRLPEGIIPQIVIDHHHPVREGLGRVAYADVRPDLGSTTTMLFQYLEAADITPNADLATAMFYGLQTDTKGLARGATIADELAYIQLLAWLDREKLIQVEQAGLPREYFQAISDGLQATRLYGSAVIAFLGAMHRPDRAAEMADILIRLEHAKAVLCLGTHDETLYLSLRTQPPGKDAGLLVQHIVTASGKAGGHGAMAGGQVPLDERSTDSLVDEIEGRFLDVMGEEKQSKIPLLQME
jgi:nanoRNase/pAp phosphatase (c-di-AMP/oligoRNAs hydrolase)